MTPDALWSINAGDTHLDEQVHLREIGIAQSAGEPLDSLCLDLIEVAAAIQLVDRMTRRPSPNGCGNSWSRTLRLRIGVRELARWSQPTIETLLPEMLAWLTDDCWLIEFAPRRGEPRPSGTIDYLFGDDSDADYVALFSGGLDSVSGVAIDLAEGRKPLLVSAVSNTRMRASQREVLGLLEGAFGRSIPHIAVDLNLHQEARENTQRSRGFGFLSMAAATALSLDMNLIRVYENGVGAINLPYVASQTGSHGTRSMHPATLARAARLFTELSDRPVRVENPHRLETKAELCRRTPVEAHEAMVASRSCDLAFTARKPQPWNCGRCTSCLLRRQSLLAAGLASLDARTSHESDLFVDEHAMSGSPADLPLESMLSQVGRLQAAMQHPEPGLALVDTFPEVVLVAPAGRVGRHASRSDLIRMYTAYVDEWASLPCAAVARFVDVPKPRCSGGRR